MSVFFSRYLWFPLAEALARMPVSRHLRELERLQWVGEADLRSGTARRLAETLESARLEVPFYRRSLGSLGKIRPQTAFEALGQAPVLTRSDLAAHRGDLADPRHGPGPGEAELVFTPEFLARAEAARWRGRGWWGMRRGDPLLVVGDGSSGDPRSVAGRGEWLRNWRRIPDPEIRYRDLIRHHRRLTEFRPRFLYGAGPALYRFALFYSEEALKPPPWLRGIFFDAGSILAGQRRVVVQTFEAPAIAEYGSDETGPFAFECREGGVHLASENVHLEILRAGKPVKDGEEGELVVTAFFNRALPLIRLNLEDRGRLLPGPCPCGRNLPRLEVLV